ncbi:MAG TPA: helix-hairpin-helix domain-containing protein [Bryobacteraceae bacterium]
MLALLFAASAHADQQLPDGPGKDTFVRICSACHGAQIVIGRGNTQDGWTQVVLNMVARGAQGSEDEFGEIVQYLAKNFPPQTAAPAANAINVNKASAQDLKTGLQLSDKEAAAIVSYRQQNGDFKSVEQLEKVPGLDASKIEAKKSRITF